MQRRKSGYDPHWFPCGHPRDSVNSIPNFGVLCRRRGWKRCKICFAELSRQYHREHPEQQREAGRQYLHKQLGKFLSRDPLFCEKTLEDLDRFTSHLQAAPGGCALWVGPFRYHWRGVAFLPRVLMYLWTYGWPADEHERPLPVEGIYARCGNPKCVRPAHLTAAPYPVAATRRQGASTGEELFQAKPLDAG